MNSKQIKTLERLFERPPRPDIKWDDLESLFAALGVERSEGRGSRVRFGFNGINLFIHKPHPEKELKRYQVKDICDFLESAGVESPQDGE